MKIQSVLIATLLVAVAGTTVCAAKDVDTKWQKHHPRREQVNDRLHHQNARIRDEVKEGDMSKADAAKLHQDDHRIRQEERDMASQNHGHVTRQEQKTLDQQENQVSKEIGH
ncbi:hypothetical protein DEO45_05265 [Rhodanobacter denitrificans]|uniref:Lipoprotein n=1 Tax=Rhodanobacter denitrificans TaxID=666685 RepID=A0A368KJI9_9GAMM|nr:hypothetical protein [Rhodanobacter denitrificans]RCS31145.1 hypothetical protein DEO45_05265 [Rhodanobacter denitrificans]